MKYFLAILLQFPLLSLPSQNEAVFRVVAKRDIQLIPRLKFLRANEDYNFQLTGISPGAITKANFHLGSITVTDSGITVHVDSTTIEGRLDTIRLFTAGDGKMHQICEQPVTVIPVYPKPPIALFFRQINPVQGWQMIRIHKRDTISQRNFMQVGQNTYEVLLFADYLGRVVSFNMDLVSGSDSTCFNSSSADFTGAMVEAIGSASPGNKIILRDIKFTSTTFYSIDTVAGPYVIYIKD